MNHYNWAQKNPALPAAAKAFPKQVFQEWLKLRRQGADLLFPEWRHFECKTRRIIALDIAAMALAQRN